jgi:hypothetical protein
MPNLQVKNVPGPVHAELRRRAEHARMTIRDYVLGLLLRDQAIPSRWEWLERVRAMPATRPTKGAAEMIREEREHWETRGRRR